MENGGMGKDLKTHMSLAGVVQRLRINLIQGITV